MKVLLHMPYTTSPSDGPQSVAYNTLQGLLERQADLERLGLDIIVLSDTGKSFRKEEFSLSNRIKIINYRCVPLRTFTGDLQNFIRILVNNKSLRDVSLIHSHNLLFTLPAALSFNRLVIHHFHGLQWKEINLVNSRYLKLSYTLMILRSKLIGQLDKMRFICISKYVLTEAKKFLNLPEDRFEVIHNPVSEGFFHAKKVENPGLIFYPSRLIPRKNHIVLLRALAILRKENVNNFTLALTGIPEDLEYYRQIINIIRKYELGNNVKFLGRISQNQIIDLYSQASIVTLTSLEESFSLAVAEAMATGTPVVASPVGIVPEAIESGKNGFIINPVDPKDIAQKIRLLLEDDNLRRKIGEEGRKTAFKSWRAKEVAGKLINLYYKILQQIK